MASRFLAVCLVTAAACSWEITLGPGDGISEVRFEEDLPNPALKRDGVVTFSSEVVLLTAERSQRYLTRFGPDKIGAIRGVTLVLTEVRIDGVDLSRTGPPRLGIAGHEVVGRPGESIELDDGQVDDLRATILGGAELRTTVTVHLEASLDALDASRPSLHIVLGVQPMLQVDVTRAL